MPHDLVALIEQATSQMASEYERIRARAIEDPGTAGDQGEENWASLLRSWLPSSYHVRTKGRIITANGSASRQMDIVILSPAYPPAMLDTKMYLAAGVLAAFECKITLRREHIDEAVQTAVHLSQLQRADRSMIHQRIMYGLLAHSQKVSTAKDAMSVIYNALIRADSRHVTDPRECLDYLCVANLGFCECGRRIRPEDRGFVVRSGYFQSFSAPSKVVGLLVTAVLQDLGKRDAALAQIVTYFFRAGLSTIQAASSSRDWLFSEQPYDLYPDPIEHKSADS